jgi:alkylation response protein AidB-like acyl-CoA dehydrogenase
MAFDFSLSDDQQAILDAADSLLKRHSGRKDALRKMIFEEKKYPEELWRAAADIGLMGALIPEEYGGSNLGLLPLTLAYERIGGRGFGGALVVLTAMDTACIVRCGSEEMKQRVLPEVAAGNLKMSFALTEPDAGSNTFRLKTHAKESADGSHFVLNGEKTYITGADVADLMLVVCRTMTAEECTEQGLPKAFGLSVFLIDPKSKGISMTRINTRGIEGFNQMAVHFDDVEVPKDALIGEKDAGTMVLFQSLNPERILAGAVATGMTEVLLERSVSYAKERVVFGDKPIGSYQSISHPLADIKIELEATRHLLYRAAWAFDNQHNPAEVGFWANAGKYKAAELAINAADRAIQTHGGSGFDEDLGIIFYWDAARLLRTAPISKEMILNFVAEHQLGLPRGY